MWRVAQNGFIDFMCGVDFPSILMRHRGFQLNLKGIV